MSRGSAAKPRLPESRRVILWSIFEQVRSALEDTGLITHAEHVQPTGRPLCRRASIRPSTSPWWTRRRTSASPSCGFWPRLAADRPNSLFFAGDLGQRIFQQPFSWKALGVDIRGRSRTLRINYRTSHQIRMQADRLLGPELSDVDGNTEKRSDTISVFNGPPPTIDTFDTPEEEIEAVSQWLTARINEGWSQTKSASLCAPRPNCPEPKRRIETAGLPYKVLDEKMATHRWKCFPVHHAPGQRAGVSGRGRDGL